MGAERRGAIVALTPGDNEPAPPTSALGTASSRSRTASNPNCSTGVDKTVEVNP
jgi:hypothetical protein